MKYHPVIEMLGVHRFKMGDFTETFLNEIRLFSKKNDFESGPFMADDAKISKLNKQQSSDEVVGLSNNDDVVKESPTGFGGRNTAKVASSLANDA